MNTQEYFQELDKSVKEIYEIANEARSKGFDPSDNVEIPLARSLAEKVVGLIATIYPQLTESNISKRIIELEKKYGKLDPAVALQIAEEVAKQKFCKFENLIEAIDAGTRIGFSYMTLGVVSSAIEGLTEIQVFKTKDGKEYFSPFYSGPIRSAGGTGAAFSLVIIDHLREVFGYGKYDPTDEEVKRTITEILNYHERITNLQYLPTEEEIEFLAKNIPVQVNGDATDKREVSNYKNLERVHTNFIRGGFCLAIAEGLAQKAPKIKKYVSSLREKGFKLSSWDFLDEYVELHKKRDVGKTDDSPTYLNDLVAGRPVFGHPSRSGSFRFRYGRGRVSGFSAASMHPATMAITDSFIATGTQLKIEKPTKGCAITVCDSIDGPIVKLFNGSVKKLEDKEEAKKIYPDVEEIIYSGDILFPFSDLSNRNHNLIRPGYVEEWWGLELEEKRENKKSEKIDYFGVSFEESIKFSEEYKIPLHPKYISYWTEISKDEFFNLIDWLDKSRFDEKIIFPYTKSSKEKYGVAKRALELLGVEHEVTIENVVISKINSKALLENLGVNFLDLKDKNLKGNFEGIKKLKDSNDSVLEIINSVSRFEIKNKAGSFIGTRMGRPEKAKLRKLVGSPNVLFPIGKEGGRLRSVNEAYEKGKVRSTFPLFHCEKCELESIYSLCEKCDSKTKKMFYCFTCKEKSFYECEQHKSNSYSTQTIDMERYFHDAVNKLDMKRTEIPSLIKGIRGTSSSEHKMEHLSKGILRAMHNLQVNKDGTIRFDATELPLVAFKPKEISVNIKKLKELGYTHDILGKELVDENQILELEPHDVILPSSPETPDERGDETFVGISKFVDSLLEKFYKMKPFYNIKKREDLVGQLGVCMAPHNCAGVICRIIGFSNTQGLFASPYMHAAIRRDCDGDEAAVMLLMDVLLNFSLGFLPKHRGGTQDAPLVLNSRIDAGEVDDQILDFELSMGYPLELYRLAEKEEHPSKVNILDVRKVLAEGGNPFEGLGFTHDTSNFNDGIICSSYKSLATMEDKLKHQMELVEKLRAVDTSDVARLVIERHFIKDIRGNLRGFSMQTFRCVGCNEILRRPPLSGKCTACNGKIIFTINEGGIKKYLEPALSLASKYDLSVYMQQNLELTKRHIESIFGKELEKQEALGKWF
jgi:DNA polymerase II large subunit